MKRTTKISGKKRIKTNWNEEINIEGAEMAAAILHDLFACSAAVMMNKKRRLVIKEEKVEPSYLLLRVYVISTTPDPAVFTGPHNTFKAP